MITDISDIPKKVTLRIICRESIPSQVKEVVNDLKNKSTLIETTYVRADDALNDINLNSGKSFDIHNIFDVDYQNKLIENNLISKNIDKSVIEMVKDLNKTINKEVPKDKAPKNIRWKPKKFEFDNMFSYGEGNVIDFAKLKVLLDYSHQMLVVNRVLWMHWRFVYLTNSAKGTKLFTY